MNNGERADMREPVPEAAEGKIKQCPPRLVQSRRPRIRRRSRRFTARTTRSATLRRVGGLRQVQISSRDHERPARIARRLILHCNDMWTLNRERASQIVRRRAQLPTRTCYLRFSSRWASCRSYGAYIPGPCAWWLKRFVFSSAWKMKRICISERVYYKAC